MKSLTREQHLDELDKVAERLKVAMATCPDTVLPQMTAQYRACLAEIAALSPEEQKTASVRDQLRERREQSQRGGTTQDRSATSKTVRAAAAGGR